MLIKRAGSLYDSGNYEEALVKLSEAEKQAKLTEDKLRIADILSKGGLALSEKKLFDTALSYYEQSIEVNRVLNNKPGLIDNLSYIGKIHSDIGKYEEGICYFNEALKIQTELKGQKGIAHNLNNLANLYSYLGKYQESARLLNQALVISPEIKDEPLTASTLINLSTIYFRQRDYEKSIEYLRRALNTAEELKEERLQVIALNLMGVVYRSQGNYMEALNYYQRALQINKDLKEDIATNLTVIGELYKELGKYDKSFKYLQQSLDISKASKNRLMTAVNLSYIGEVEYKKQNYDKALELYNSSLREFQELGFKDRIARSFSNIGYVKGEMKEPEGAIGSFDKAITIYKELGDREWVRVALFGKGVYSEEKGDLISAEKSYKEAVDIFESIRQDVAGGEEAEQLFSDVNVNIYEKLVSLLIRQGKTQEALEYIQRSRSKSLRDNLLKSGLGSSDDNVRGQLRRYDELSKKEASISYELNKEQSTLSPSQEKIDNLSSTLTKTREEFTQIISKLKKENPRIYSVLGISPEKLSDPGRLPQDFSILQYFVTENETYIFIANQYELKVKSVSLKKEELNRMVSDFRRLIFESSPLGTEKLKLNLIEVAGNKKLLDELSTNLYQYLIKPVKNYLSTAKVAGIIPFGILNYLPFQALTERKSDGKSEFFLEQKNVVYITNIDQLHMASQSEKINEYSNIIAFGNPDLGEPDLALPYSEKEVMTIKNIFPDTLVFVEGKATKENFRKNWGKHGIVHLSAHGVLNDEGQFILLAPIGTGKISTTDITELPLAKEVNFVVLSACSTAIDPFQKNPTGTQLATLAYAFEWVEVPSVIATLWDISDVGTANLMKLFYTNLKHGTSPYTALREAQLEMIRKGDKYSHPYYWAPFVVFGSYQ